MEKENVLALLQKWFRSPEPLMAAQEPLHSFRITLMWATGFVGISFCKHHNPSIIFQPQLEEHDVKCTSCL